MEKSRLHTLLYSSDKKLIKKIENIFRKKELIHASLNISPEFSHPLQANDKKQFSLIIIDYSLSGEYDDFHDSLDMLLSSDNAVIIVSDKQHHIPDSIEKLAGCRHLSIVKNRDISSFQLHSLIKYMLITVSGLNDGLDFREKELLAINSASIRHFSLIQNLLINTNEGLWQWDVKEKRFILSENLKASLGYTKRQLQDTLESFFEVVHPADKKRVRLAFKEFLTQKTDKLVIEMRLKSRKEGYKWYLYRGFGCWDANNQPVKIIGVQANIDGLKSEVKRLESLALYDSLTKLPNRNLLSDRLTRAISISDRSKKSLGLLFIDLNKFKQINDNHGHQTGDWVLIEAAKRISKSVRQVDTVARMSGDEFVALLPNISDQENIRVIMNRIEKAISRTMNFSGLKINITCSIGYSIYPEDGKNIDALLEKADMEMYLQKGLHHKFAETVLS